jgi:hypothetical protein
VSRTTNTLLVAAAAALLLPGCAGADPSGPSAVAARFARAVTASDDVTLCALLSPAVAEAVAAQEDSCPQAVGSLELPDPGSVRHVDVDGRSARVELDHDTLFLSQFPGGWRVIGAGCTARPGDQPYDCTASKG